MARKTPPFLDWIILLPTSKVRYAVPCKTMSSMVLNALGDNLSVGDIKFPAALLE